MTQPSLVTPTAPLDLRSLRTSFLDRKIAYALSFGFTLSCTGIVAKGARCVRLSVVAPKSPDVADGVFHVLGGDRVPGIDGNGRDLPAGFAVKTLDANILFHTDKDAPGPMQPDDRTLVFGSLEGRLILEARAPNSEKTDGEPTRISMSYDGTLQPSETTAFSALKFPSGEAMRASAFVAPFFETSHPKYHWLTENACIAYGTWELAPNGAIVASFDVYALE